MVVELLANVKTSVSTVLCRPRALWRKALFLTGTWCSMRVVLIFLVVTVPEWFLKWWILSIHLDNYFLDLLTMSLMSRLRKIEVKQCQSWGWVPRSQKMHLLGSVQSIDPLEFLYMCTFAVCCPVHASLWPFQPFPVFSISMDPFKF